MAHFTLRYNRLYLKDLVTIQTHISDRINSNKRKTRPHSKAVHTIKLLHPVKDGGSVTFFIAESNLYVIGFACGASNYFFSDFYNTSYTSDFPGNRLTSSSSHNDLGTFSHSRRNETIFFHSFWEAIQILSRSKLTANSPALSSQEKRALSQLIISVSEALRFQQIKEKINEISHDSQYDSDAHAEFKFSSYESNRVFTDVEDNADVQAIRQGKGITDSLCVYRCGFTSSDFEHLIRSWENISKADIPVLDVAM